MPFFGVPIRNGLPIGLGSSAGFGVQPFDPSYLFSAGEQGAWYDPSDFSTLFQDSAGTTPVTAVEQFVGLMLDKSKGLVLGNELYANQVGAFDNGTGGATATYTSATQTVSVTVAGTNPGYPRLAINLGLVTNKTYYVIGRIDGTRTGVVTVRLATAGSANNLAYNSTTGVFEGRVVAAASGIEFLHNGTVTGDRNIAALSVRELPGNHAFQTSSAKRPKLASRYNLLDYTEEFDVTTGGWGKTNTTVTANAAVAPNGTTTADELFTTAATTLFAIGQNTTIAASNTASIYAKASTTGFLQLSYNGDTTSYANFDLSAGVVGTSSGTVTHSITDVGSGWYRCTVVNTSTAVTGITWCIVNSASATRRLAFAGTGAESIYIWGADLRPASQATGLIGPTYQRVAAATVYDTAGFLPYLAFDGLDWHMTMDSLVSGTSYFEGANAPFTMFAGARRNTTGSFMAIVALCDNTNAISFMNDQLILGFNDVTTQVMAETRYIPDIKRAEAGTNAAPQTNVITWDRTATDGVARVDGVAGTPADQTQPALGLALATIGAQRRDPTPTIGAYLNGWLYSLIVRGAQSTQSQIEATEAWVNSRTGAY